jgi:hypothetical protein
MMGNSNDCINLLMGNITQQGLGVSKHYERRRKILDTEVGGKAL